MMLPEYHTRDDLAVSTKTYFPSDDSVTLDDLEKIYTRDSLGNALIDRRTDDVFNKWLEIRSDDETVKKEIDALFIRLDVKSNFNYRYGTTSGGISYE